MDKQMTMSALSDELAQVRTKKKEFLAQIERIVPWKEWLTLIQPCYYKGERGNKPYPLETMLRLYLLQNLYDLSDEATAAEAIDSRAFSDFCGVDSSNQVPDGDTIGRFRNLLVKNGLQGVFINGSSGEGYMLTEEERMRLAERWVSVAPEGFKVIVHVGSCCVKASRMLAEHAQKIGAWGIGAMAPPFPKIGRIEELVKYIEEIAAGAPELPFYYYHIPAFNGAFLPMVKLLEAVDGRVPNFAGIKYTFESMYEYNQCRLYKNGKFDMLHGQDETILPCLAMGGAQGGIGGTTNYNGKELVGIIEAWEAGDIETARERQNFSQEVINVICHFRGNIVGGKRIMKLIGLDLGKNRTPFQNMTDEEEAQMKAELEAIHFFDRCNKF